MPAKGDQLFLAYQQVEDEQPWSARAFAPLNIPPKQVFLRNFLLRICFPAFNGINFRGDQISRMALLGDDIFTILCLFLPYYAFWLLKYPFLLACGKIWSRRNMFSFIMQNCKSLKLCLLKNLLIFFPLRYKSFRGNLAPQG